MKDIACLKTKSEKSDWSFCYSKWTHREKHVERKIQLSDRWHQLILDMIRSAGVNFFANKTKVLEVGCGVGGLCIWASKKSKYVTGLDIAKSALKFGNILRKKFRSNVSFVTGDARSLPFKDGSYDIVICTETLEHVHDYTKAFDELVRVTKKSGYIIITVPNHINVTHLDIAFEVMLYLKGKKSSVWRQPADVNRFNIFVTNKLFERRDLRVIIRRGVGLITIPSNHPKIKSIERRLNRSFDKLKFLCLNIGVIAQKMN